MRTLLQTCRRAAAPALVTAALTVATGAVTTLAQPVAAYADSASMESQFIADMNAARSAAGLAPYAVAGDLTAVARSHSQQMASRDSLYHNPTLTSDVANWQAVGENVGEGPTVQDIHQAFMNSPEHRANILDHDFTQVGVGVSVDKDGIVWVTEDFREPMSAPSHTSTPAHHTSSQPAAAAAPAGSTATGSTAPASASGSASGGSVTAAATGPSPRALLRQRLRELRHHRAHTHAGRASDPVVRAFDYVEALSRLAH